MTANDGENWQNGENSWKIHFRRKVGWETLFPQRKVNSRWEKGKRKSGAKNLARDEQQNAMEWNRGKIWGKIG